jgi:hypothetical protein
MVAALSDGNICGSTIRASRQNGYEDPPYSQSQPDPLLDGLRNAQRLMAQQNPKITALKVEQLTDARFVRKLDESGFIDRLYAAR